MRAATPLPIGSSDLLNATFDLAAVYLGDRLGLYRALAETEPSTSTELAERTGLVERYVREWLEHGAVTGFLEGRWQRRRREGPPVCAAGRP